MSAWIHIPPQVALETSVCFSSIATPSQLPLSCMEIEEQQLNTFDLPPKVFDIILAARHPSMKDVCACHWSKFEAWCGTRQIDSLQAKLSDVLSFVLSLAWPCWSGQS